VGTDLLLLLSGLALLLGGGEALVRGAGGLALAARITPAVVGLTVVAAGTSAPELVVSLQAAWQGRPGLAAGNIVGSNLFNIGAILGLTALLRPLRIQGSSVRLEWPVLLLASMQFYLLIRDGALDRLEGACLLTGLAAFTAYAVRLARREVSQAEASALGAVADAAGGRRGRAALALNLGATALGVGLLAGGSTLLVRGAVGLAEILDISETVIGLTIVAAGTSAPELATSLIAAWRGRDDIAVGNVIGSNIFNLLGIGGATALLQPLPVPAEIIVRDAPWMLGATILLLPLIKSGLRIGRWEGALLLAGFLAYLATLA
jgi:cation:H+ antiporter